MQHRLQYFVYGIEVSEGSLRLVQLDVHIHIALHVGLISGMRTKDPYFFHSMSPERFGLAFKQFDNVVAYRLSF